jgi:DNA polymerase III subunit delta'
MAFSSIEALQRLRGAESQGRLAHAYLVTAPDLGTLESFAAEFRQLVLGAAGGGEEKATHPDWHEVRPESKSRRIVTEQMRELEDVLRLKPQLGERKVGVIFEAERLMPAAANAFLKTLEEPPSGTHLLLLSLLPDQLLTTIVSRCLIVSLRGQPRQELTPAEKAVRDLTQELLGSTEGPGTGEIFAAVRKFQAVLAEVRAAALDEMEEVLKEEKQQYANRTEGKWLEEQEEKLTALTEGTVLRERARLLQVVGDVLAERLRRCTEGVDPRIHAQEATRLLQRLQAVEQLRGDLDRSMNESLAIEAGFLEIFGPLSS